MKINIFHVIDDMTFQRSLTLSKTLFIHGIEENLSTLTCYN